MGKISDAIERLEKEKAVKTQVLPIGKSKKGQEEPKPFAQLKSKTRLDPKLLAYSAPESIDAENFKQLRSHLLFPKGSERPRTIMVTSTFPREGKTFVASNLAVTMAMGVHQHILIIDCDLRAPQLHEIFGHSNKEGLHEFLDGKVRLPDVIKPTMIPKLSLLTAGSPSSRSSELLSSSTMKEFLDEVKARYDDRLIIVDTTPSQVTAEASVLASFMESVIFVVMAGKTPRESVLRSIENIGRHKIAGVVFNGYSGAYTSYNKYYKRYYGRYHK